MMKLNAITRFGFLTKMEEARNRGSLRKQNPHSTLPCSFGITVAATVKDDDLLLLLILCFL